MMSAETKQAGQLAMIIPAGPPKTANRGRYAVAYFGPRVSLTSNSIPATRDAIRDIGPLVALY